MKITKIHDTIQKQIPFNHIPVGRVFKLTEGDEDIRYLKVNNCLRLNNVFKLNNETMTNINQNTLCIILDAELVIYENRPA